MNIAIVATVRHYCSLQPFVPSRRIFTHYFIVNYKVSGTRIELEIIVANKTTTAS